MESLQSLVIFPDINITFIRRATKQYKTLEYPRYCTGLRVVQTINITQNQDSQGCYLYIYISLKIQRLFPTSRISRLASFEDEVDFAYTLALTEIILKNPCGPLPRKTTYFQDNGLLVYKPNAMFTSSNLVLNHQPLEKMFQVALQTANL